MSAVRRRHDGRRLLLPVLILPPSGTDLRSVPASALVDTGTTTSGITAAIADQLDLPVMGKRVMTFGHADEQVERYIFRVGIGSDLQENPTFPFVFPEVDGFRLRPAFRFDAIVGMDILRYCDLEMRRDGWSVLRFGR